MNKFIYLILSILIWSCGQTTDDQISFNRDVRPILNKNCLRCHGGVKASGEFSLLFEEDAFGKTQSGQPAIVRGNHKKSEFYKRLVNDNPDLRMPYESEPLSQDEIDVLTTWIDQGAKWEKHWAYIPTKQNIQPPEIDTVWAKNDIDKFVYSKMTEKGLTPSPEAEKDVLLRRLYLDLTGLPPTNNEAKAFLEDNSKDAYEKLVDRLLASPHFGERWATMWLDLARYADSKGYEKDSNREIWKFRDWVINAFNRDMPFDQFTIEQLAGDLLSNPTEQQLIATAFHRNTEANDEGGTNDEEFRVASVIDRVSTTYEVWQGTTMACVQCHSHPYDPFRHKEFYESMAFFNNAEDRDAYYEEPKLYTYSEEDVKNVKQIMAYIDENLQGKDQLKEQAPFLHDQKELLLEHLDYRVVEAETYDHSHPFIELSNGLKGIFQIQENTWVEYDRVDLTNVEQMGFLVSTNFKYGGDISVHIDSLNGQKIGQARITKTNGGFKEFKTDIEPLAGAYDLYLIFSIGDTPSYNLFTVDKVVYYEKEPRMASYSQEFQKKVEELAAVPTTSTPIIQELSGVNARKTHLFERGSWLTLGEEVQRGIPDIYSMPKSKEPTDRLAFAKWLVSEDNPLSARVAVNRFWEQVFGFGLVESMEEFGSQGEKPTHPELLDWMATRFIKNHHWKVKPLLREIMRSATYRQSAEADAFRIENDPLNKWLSRMSRTRLSAEQIRDQVLTVSGLLNRTIGGSSVVTSDVDGGWRGIPDWAIQGDSARYRRSIYTLWKRGTPPSNMIAFDSPDRSVCTSRRIRTNTPLQALNLLNDDTFFTASQALAKTMMDTEETLDNQLKYGYQMVTCRELEGEKLKVLKELYQEALEHYSSPTKGNVLPEFAQNLDEDQKYKMAALALVSNVLLNLDEFIVKG